MRSAATLLALALPAWARDPTAADVDAHIAYYRARLASPATGAAAEAALPVISSPE
jgi:hypothetical protein